MSQHIYDWSNFTEQDFKKLQQDIRSGAVPTDDDELTAGTMQVGDITVYFMPRGEHYFGDTYGYSQLEDKNLLDIQARWDKGYEYVTQPIPLKEIAAMSYQDFQQRMETRMPAFLREQQLEAYANPKETSVKFDWSDLPEENFLRMRKKMQRVQHDYHVSWEDFDYPVFQKLQEKLQRGLADGSYPETDNPDYELGSIQMGDVMFYFTATRTPGEPSLLKVDGEYPRNGEIMNPHYFYSGALALTDVAKMNYEEFQYAALHQVLLPSLKKKKIEDYAKAPTGYWESVPTGSWESQKEAEPIKPAKTEDVYPEDVYQKFKEIVKDFQAQGMSLIDIGMALQNVNRDVLQAMRSSKEK